MPCSLAHGDHFDVFDRFDIAAPAHHVFRAAEFDGAAADIVVAHADGIHDTLDREAIGRELIGIQVHLILAHESAQTRDLRHAFDGADLIAQVPILKRAQLRQIMLAALIHQGVLENPADPCGIWPQRRGNPPGKSILHLVHVFENAASRPINVRAVFEDDVHIGEAEVGKAAHELDLRRRDHGSHDRVGDLVFHDRRVSSHPGGVNDDLDIGEVGNRIKRRILQRPDSSGAEKQHHEKDEKFIFRAGFDNFFDHRAMPYCAVTVNFSCTGFCPGRCTDTPISHVPAMARLTVAS